MKIHNCKPMTQNENVVDEVKSDSRIDSVSIRNKEMYLTVCDPTTRDLVESYYRKNYNVDVSTRGLNIQLEW